MKMAIPQNIFSFFEIMNALKQVERFKGMIFWRDYEGNPKRFDSVPEHCYMMLVLYFLCKPHLTHDYDDTTIFYMSVFHDMPEFKSGDPCPFGDDYDFNGPAFSKEAKEEKFLKEHHACKEILENLDNDTLRAKIYDVWMEYEENKTPEARLVKVLDKLEGAMQSLLYRKGKAFDQRHLQLSIDYLSGYLKDVDPILLDLGKYIISEFEKFRVQ